MPRLGASRSSGTATFAVGSRACRRAGRQRNPPLDLGRPAERDTASTTSPSAIRARNRATRRRRRAARVALEARPLEEAEIPGGLLRRQILAGGDHLRACARKTDSARSSGEHGRVLVEVQDDGVLDASSAMSSSRRSIVPSSSTRAPSVTRGCRSNVTTVWRSPAREQPRSPCDGRCARRRRVPIARRPAGSRSSIRRTTFMLLIEAARCAPAPRTPEGVVPPRTRPVRQRLEHRTARRPCGEASRSGRRAHARSPARTCPS